jgi:hypothetical protein
LKPIITIERKQVIEEEQKPKWTPSIELVAVFCLVGIPFIFAFFTIVIGLLSGGLHR